VSGFTDAFERAGSAVALAGPVSDERIQRFEEAYELEVPRTLRKFVATLGDVAATDHDIGLRLLGLSDDPKRRPTIASSLYLARTAGRFPADLVPVEILGEQQLACVRVDGSPDPPVGSPQPVPRPQWRAWPNPSQAKRPNSSARRPCRSPSRSTWTQRSLLCGTGTKQRSGRLGQTSTTRSQRAIRNLIGRTTGTTP